eukprot:3665362-Prorocentrum_lima.AAC.1
MTSSLVGSEMCIRDRGHSRHFALLPGPHLAKPTVTILPLKRGSAVHEACLLYTSDAADDM